jgi:hypothetical protein
LEPDIAARHFPLVPAKFFGARPTRRLNALCRPVLGSARNFLENSASS